MNNNKNIYSFNRKDINKILCYLKSETNETNNETKVIIKNMRKVDKIFRKYELISFLILFFGCFIILYGAYYYKLALIIHSCLFIYYTFAFIILFTNEKYHKLYYFYHILFSFISGIFIYIFLGTDDR